MLLKQVSTLLFTAIALSTTLAQAGDDWMPGNQFFTIDETVTASAPSINPVRLAGSLVLQGWDISGGSYNVMRWLQTRTAPPRPNYKYVRDLHFGGWIDRPSEPSCLSTRALVLVRDSRRQVTYVPGNNCSVASGLWLDPYSTKTLTDTKDIQIDHVVPLKHAFISGAWTWDWRTRCAYSNFIGNRYHLLPVDGPTNNEKGDSAPHAWMPPNPGFRCEYLASWLRIKLIWRLMISEPEAIAIMNMMKQLNCPAALFQVSKDELAQQRQLITRGQMDCPANGPAPRTPDQTDVARPDAIRR